MDNETKQLLKKNLKISEENNKLLKRMRRNAFWGGILRLIWWAVIIGLPVYLYFTVFEPYLTSLNETYESLKGGVENLQQIPNPLEGLLNKLPGINRE